MFDIYYQALSSENNEFGEIPVIYQPIIQTTLQNDILIQAGYEREVPKLSFVQKLSVKAYQRAQNKVSADDARKRNKQPTGDEE